MAGQSAQGTEIQSGDGATPELFTTIGKVTNIAGPTLHNPALDSTGLEDAWREFISSGLIAVDPVTISIHFDPDTAELHDVLVDRAIARSADNYQISFPDFANNTVAFGVGDVTVDPANTIDEVGHGLTTGQPIRFSTAGTIPAGLVAGTTYYAIWVDANTYSPAATNALAVAGTAVAITTQGAGAHALHYGQRWDFSAYITDASPSGAVGDTLKGELSFQITDATTITG